MVKTLIHKERDLRQALSGFTGTETYTKHWCGGTILLTDGAKFLAEQAGGYWLMDLIASTLPLHRWDSFVAVLWERKGPGGTLAVTDANGHMYYHQDVPLSDFPFRHFRLYAAWDGYFERYVVLLPGEY